MKPTDPVFARPHSVDDVDFDIHRAQSGITLRAYLAGQALPGLLASPLDSPAASNHTTCRDFAKAAVKMADALIEELNK